MEKSNYLYIFKTTSTTHMYDMYEVTIVNKILMQLLWPENA